MMLTLGPPISRLAPFWTPFWRMAFPAFLWLLIAPALLAQTTPNLPTAPTAVDLPLAGGGDASTYSLDVDETGYTTVTVCDSGCDYTAAQFATALSDADCDPNGGSSR
jgi:hypothetical protein